MYEDGYTFRAGLLSLIAAAVAALTGDDAVGLDVGTIEKALARARATAEKPVDESGPLRRRCEHSARPSAR